MLINVNLVVLYALEWLKKYGPMGQKNRSNWTIKNELIRIKDFCPNPFNLVKWAQVWLTQWHNNTHTNLNIYNSKLDSTIDSLNLIH